MVKKIIISGDLLRVKNVNGKAENFHEKRINKYYDFLVYQVQEAVNIPVEKLNTDNTDFSPENMYKLCGIPYGTDNDWLQIYDLIEIPQEAIEYYKKYIEDSLVIYIEMPLIFKRIHTLLKLPYIDITVHPIRFLDDHMFGMSTNEVSIFDYMRKYQIDENEFYLHANQIKSIVDYNPLPIQENSVLIAGQTNVDKALYCNGKCLSIMDYAKKIEELGEKYSIVYYKAHPFNTDLRKIHEFLRQYPFVKLCPSDWNTYKMLANPNLKKVYAITSGVLYEAKYFGKEAENLYKPYLHLDYSKDCVYSEETYLSIYNHFMNPEFWASVLKDVVDVNTECEKIVLRDRPNRLRATFNDYWSYTELDPTVITVTKKYEDRIRGLERATKVIQNDEVLIREQSQIIQQQQQSIIDLTNNVNLLQAQMDILRNDPSFEPNIFKRIAKKTAFYLSQNSIYFNPIFVLMKLKAEANKYIEKPNKITAVKGITYRPHAPHGGRGGGGAVLSAMNEIIRNQVNDLPMTYSYSERDGIWHTLKNRYFSYHNYNRFINPNSHLLPLYAAIAFAIEKTKNEQGKLYVCHEYATAYGLALMKKRYILVIHSQGTRVDEKITLGEKLEKSEIKIISECEKVAIENAIYVSFPSEGAKNIYFSSKYNKASSKNVGPTLYNTIYVDRKPVPINSITRDNDTITFISVGTTTEAKGQDQVCGFFESLLQNETEKRIRWICVGKGPLREQIIQRATKLQDGYKNFEFVEFEKIDFAQVQYLYTISDIYLMMHRVSIFDLATLEAMKHGCAVMLTDVGGNKEFNKCENVVFVDKAAKTALPFLNEENLKELKAKNLYAYNNYFSKQCFKDSYVKHIQKTVDEYNSRFE